MRRASFVLLPLLLVSFAFAPAGTAQEPAPTCSGLAVTILGTQEKDRIRGTEGRDVIHALDGDDVVDGMGGDDNICLGFGNDVGRGGEGWDTLIGRPGDDQLIGGDGSDIAEGGANTSKGDKCDAESETECER